MRFIVKQIKVTGSGASDLTRYIARSKLDPAREGHTARPLFTPEADRLSFWQAREWLSITGGKWARHDALHYVVSFAEAREYELLGNDEDERQQEIRTAVRQALAAALEGMGLANMRWTAGLHRNTAHPHCHLLLNKNAVHRATGDLIYVPRLARAVLPHNTTQPTGAKVLAPGSLITTFAAHIDARHRDRTRWLQFESAWRDAAFTRALLAPEILHTRPPTPAEQLAGRWLLAELRLNLPGPAVLTEQKKQLAEMAAHRSQADAVHTLHTLRAALAQLDKAALANGQVLPPAYLNNEELRAVLLAPPALWRVTSHQQNPALENSPPRLLAPPTMPARVAPASFPHTFTGPSATGRDAPPQRAG